MTAQQQIWQSEALWSFGVPIGGTILLLGMGLFSLRSRLIEVRNKQDFVGDFRERFITYCNSRGNDRDAYTWLTLNSPRMQSEMGSYGMYEAFKPPAANYMIRNYQIITNMLPELRRYIDMNNESMGTMFASTIDGYIKAIDEALLRYIGVLDERECAAFQSLKNPLLWLRTGVEQILSTPLLILVGFGLMAGSAVRRLQSNFIFKAIAALATIVGLLSGIMTMILGWHETTDIIHLTLTKWWPSGP
jgi:hypothetical protein